MATWWPTWMQTHTFSSPSDFAGDVWAERVSAFWADSPSVYGPVFTYLSAAVIEIAGNSYTAARLLFQLLALIAYLGITPILWIRTKRLDATLVFAANPIVLAFGVNDAHCDMLMGLGVVAAVLPRDQSAGFSVHFVSPLPF